MIDWESCESKKKEAEILVAAAVRCPVLGGSGAWVAPQVSAITLLATALATAPAVARCLG